MNDLRKQLYYFAASARGQFAFRQSHLKNAIVTILPLDDELNWGVPGIRMGNAFSISNASEVVLIPRTGESLILSG